MMRTVGAGFVLIIACMAMFSGLAHQASGQSTTLTISPGTARAGSTITFSSACVGTCAGPSNIIDYGTGTCQTTVPSGLPDCSYTDIATTPTPCVVSSSSGTSTYGQEQVSSSSGGTVTHTLCAYAGSSVSSPETLSITTGASPYVKITGSGQSCAIPGSPTTAGCTCPALTLSSYSLVPQEQTIQPGAFDPVSFSINIDLSNQYEGWAICGESSYGTFYSSTCPVTFYPCKANTQAPPLNPVSTLDYVSGYCSTESGTFGGNPCNLYSSSSSVFAYTPGTEQPGAYDLCFYMKVDAVNGGEYSPAEVSCQYTIYGWSGAVANYVVSPFISSNANVLRNLSNGAQNANYYIQQPLSLSITDSQGDPTQQITWPNSATFTVTGSPISNDQGVIGQYPLYMELSSPGIDNCEQGGTYSGLAGAAGTGAVSGLPLCGQNPSPGILPCVISYTRGPDSIYPIAASSNTAIIQTGLLTANVYTVCGYEGDYPSNNADPAQIFFTMNTFTLSCPPYDPTCSTFSGVQAPPPLSISSIQAEACSLYLAANQILIILALTLMLIGGILYATANTLPGQTRGVIQAYGFGLVIAGVASLIIAAVSIYALTLVSGYNVPYILYTLNSCPAPT